MVHLFETELGVANEWVCSDVRQRMGEWQERYCV